MNHYERLQQQIQRHIMLVLIAINVSIIVVWAVLMHFFHLNVLVLVGIGLCIAAGLSYFFSKQLTKYATEPLRVLWQAILHVSPEHHGTAAPNLEQAKVGRELVTTLALQVYQLASSTAVPAPKAHESATVTQQGEAVVNNLPIPVIVLDRQQNVVFANKATSDYLQLPINEITGQNMYSILDLAFPSDQTFDAWLNENRKDKITATGSWERVRLETAGQKIRKQFDMVAYYNKNNPNNVETILGLFDQTNKYSQDDDSMGFIALAVHELRTPLTMLRGYIEALDEELQGKLSPELADFMKKMEASSQQLASFVTNILNVARVEENQLFLQLKEENWPNTLRAALKDMNLRAQVHSKHITLQIEENLPTVAVDRTTITEVINNLVDNAIKYSDKSDRIIVKTYLGNDGFVETTVQDFGIGIPANIIGNLFEKFYRNHRSRAQVGGTGLGLYLSKSILTAHGGQVWVQSKEGLGSTFGFSLLPYAKLAEEQKKTDNKEDITRTAHGWIKNHSFYRR
jgi:signal transduction histidine kinase